MKKWRRWIILSISKLTVEQHLMKLKILRTLRKDAVNGREAKSLIATKTTVEVMKWIVSCRVMKVVRDIEAFQEKFKPDITLLISRTS